MHHRVDARVKVCRIEGLHVEKIADLDFACEGTDSLGALVDVLRHIGPADESSRLQRASADRMLGDLFRRGNLLRERLQSRRLAAAEQLQRAARQIAERGGTAHARCYWDRPHDPEGWHHLQLEVVPENWGGGIPDPAAWLRAGTKRWSFMMGLPRAEDRTEETAGRVTGRVRSPLNESLGGELWQAQERITWIAARQRRVRSILEHTLDECLLAGL